MLVEFVAWLAEGGTVYVLHDPWRTMSRYKRGREREIIAETIGTIRAEISTRPTILLHQMLPFTVTKSVTTQESEKAVASREAGVLFVQETE